MTGKIHRYEVLEESALLPGVGPFPEPDYWSHDFPVMAICEPGIRSSQDVGDWVFHVPKKNQFSLSPEYQVTGMMKIDKMMDSREIIKSNEFEEDWIRRFKIDLADCGHLIDDLLDKGNKKITSVQGRVTNHLIGDPEESMWFGATGVSIHDIAKSRGISLGSFKGPQIAELSDAEANEIAAELAQRFEEEGGTPPNAVF